MQKQDLEAAGEHLLLAAQTPGSPQLSNMLLAKEILESGGEKEIVLAYLEQRGTFRGGGREGIKEMADTRLAQWKREVKAGDIPEFGANLYY